MKIVVLGAGVAGITTAYFLAREGFDVRVIDRCDAPASEGSYANAGLIHASVAEPWNSPVAVLELLRSLVRRDGTLLLNPGQIPGLIFWGLRFLSGSRYRVRSANTLLNARLAVYSQQLLARLREETGIDFDNTGHGMMKLFQTQKRLEAITATARLLEPLGVVHRRVGVDELIESEPLLADGCEQWVGGVHFPNDESACPRLFARGLATLAESSLGVRFHYRTHILDLRMKRNRLERVVTDQGDFDADAVVIAAGPESAGLARRAGLRLPIRPVKGYSTTIALVSDVPSPRVPLMDDSRKLVINRLGNRLRISGTAEFAGHDRSVRADRIEQLLQRAGATVPALADHLRSTDHDPWACLRPMTADGPPILGATPVSNVYLNAGSGHLGWTMAAGSAKLVTDVIAGRETAIPVEGFSVRRYWSLPGLA